MQTFIFIDQNQAFYNWRAVDYQIVTGEEKEGKIWPYLLTEMVIAYKQV